MQNVVPVATAAITEFPFSFHHTVHEFNDLETADFDIEEYSRLKFGCATAAKRFGREMADTFFAKHRDLLAQRRCVVIAAPSSGIPIASELLAEQFLYRLNHHLALAGLAPAETTVIHRTANYNNDYATVSVEERKALLAGIDMFANREFIADKLLLFIDDVRITGTHEERIKSYLLANEMQNPHIFVCLASYLGDHASIEDKLNHSHVKNLSHLLELAATPGHKPTTRVVRLALESDASEFVAALRVAPNDFLMTIYNYAIMREYSTNPKCRENFLRLQGYLSTLL